MSAKILRKNFVKLRVTYLAFKSQNIEKTLEDSYVRAISMFSQTASNSSAFQWFQIQFR